MIGNVWEWVKDSWHENYNDAPSDGSAGKKETPVMLFGAEAGEVLTKVSYVPHTATDMALTAETVMVSV